MRKRRAKALSFAGVFLALQVAFAPMFAPALAQTAARSLLDGARAAAAAGRLDEASALNQKAVQAAQGNSEFDIAAAALADLAGLALRRQDFTAAARFAADAARSGDRANLSPSDRAELDRLVGLVAFRSGALEDAAGAYLNGANRIAPQQSTPIRRLALRDGARVRAQQNRLDEAATLLRTAIAEADASDRIGFTADLANVLLAQGRPRDAADLAQRALGAPKRSDAAAEAGVMLAHLVNGRALSLQGDGRGARRAFEAGLAVAARLRDRPMQAELREGMANVSILEGDGIAAAQGYRTALELLSIDLGARHPRLAAPLAGAAIGEMLSGQWRASEASFQRAIAVADADTARGRAPAARLRVEQARMLTLAGRFSEGADTAAAAKKTLDAQASDDLAWRGFARSTLGLALSRLGRDAEARLELQAAIDLIGRSRGQRAPDLAPGLLELALVDLRNQRFDAAGASARRAEEILSASGSRGPLAFEAKSLAGEALARSGRIEAGLAQVREARRAMSARGTTTIGAFASTEAAILEQKTRRRIYERELEIAALAGPKALAEASTFEAIQALQLGAAGASISQFAARFSLGDGRLAVLLRQRQDAALAWTTLEKQLAATLRANETQTPISAEDIARARAKRDALASDVARIDASIAREFPAFERLLRPSPVTQAALRAALRPGEAYLLHAATAERTFLMLVRPDRPATVIATAPMGARDLSDLVRRVRLGLEIPTNLQLRAFDGEAAYALYRAVIAPIETDLDGVATLISTVDDRLSSVPLQALVTAPPKVARSDSPDDYAFLVRKWATAWSPSAGAFVALRALGDKTAGAAPFFGVGDPDLDGPPNDNRGLTELGGAFRAGVQPNQLRSLGSLPNSRREIELLAKALGAGASDTLFAAAATESAIKTRALRQYRIIAFATHGLLAGEFADLSEPGLVLTPPSTPTAIDDGLLAASEIAQLDLDADWVILSACNTAGDDPDNQGQGLSGLARAFFFAGARTVLVSSWAVETNAAERLTVGAVSALQQAPSKGKAEALRQSMLAEMQRDSHPALWAPFLVTGDN